MPFTPGALRFFHGLAANLPSLLAREYEALLPLVRWINGSFGLPRRRT